LIPLLDLFSGIGGFSLGLERTGGFKTVAFCEINSKSQRVLGKHWPDVPIYNDIKELTLEKLQSDGVPLPRAICGGFPCQDISNANREAEGIVGERSGLWSEMFRLIRDVRPTWAVVENVSALRAKGLALVLQNLSEIGYDTEWHCIPASAVGAPHQRDRVWVLAHANQQRLEGRFRKVLQECSRELPVRTGGPREGRLSDFWLSEPNVGRVANGVPRRVDRLKQLGNSVVPQIVETIGRVILDTEQGK
jgi:DNA (cytosine-5)-methyltransferase 1